MSNIIIKGKNTVLEIKNGIFFIPNSFILKENGVNIHYKCISDLSRPHHLPRGGFGLVIFYKGENNKEIAIKFINLTKLRSTNSERTVIKAIEEVNLLKELHKKLNKDCSDKIINFIGSKKMKKTYRNEDGYDKQEYQYLLIFLEKMDSDLYDYLIDFPNYNLTEAKHIMCQVAFSISCLHKIGIVYNDLKPSNVLINHDKTCRLTDFNCIVKKNQEHLPEKQQKFTGCSTSSFRSPEQVDTAVSYDFKADVWQLGLLFVCVLEKDPHSLISSISRTDQLNKSQVIKNLTKKKLEPFIQNCTSVFPELQNEYKSLSDMIYGMLEVNTEDRWCMDQVLNCDFLKCINKEKKQSSSKHSDLIKKENRQSPPGTLPKKTIKKNTNSSRNLQKISSSINCKKKTQIECEQTNGCKYTNGTKRKYCRTKTNKKKNK
jgi:serine/threonine protein kinase